MPRCRSWLAVLLCVTCGLTTAVQAGTQSKPLYTLVETVSLGEPDRWDYLTFDSASDRVFVSHGDRVTVVDGRSGAILGNVESFPGGTHGIAIVTSLGRGYTDDGEAGVAAAFNLKTLRPLSQIKAEPDADGIVYDRASGRLFVIDGDSGEVTVIDPNTDTVVSTIDGGGGLEFAVADGLGKLYVNGAEEKEILRIDTATDKVDARWPVPDCLSPHGLAIDLAAHRLFSSCENKTLVVLNADTGAKVASLPIGAGSDAVAFDPKRKRIFSSNFDGTLTIIGERGPDSYAVEGTVPTMVGARTMTIDPKSGRLYLVGADIKINSEAAPTDYRHRFVITPGSAKLLFFDPAF